MADVTLHKPNGQAPTEYKDVTDVQIHNGVLTFYSHGKEIQTTVPFVVEEKLAANLYASPWAPPSPERPFSSPSLARKS
jgi:hypothetical protein